MKYLIPAIRFKLFMTVLLGLIYPFAMTGMSQAIFPVQANGSFLMRGGQAVGSQLIGQNFESSRYFWPRPSAVSYNPLPSGGSNAGPLSSDLIKSVDLRRDRLKAAHPEQSLEPPQDLLFASASGLDPHISVAATKYQMLRVAKARNMPLEVIQDLVDKNSMSKQLGFLGEETVNVLALNLALDKSQGIDSKPVALPPSSTQ